MRIRDKKRIKLLAEADYYRDESPSYILRGLTSLKFKLYLYKVIEILMYLLLQCSMDFLKGHLT